jgi:hypothetical protein
MDCLDHVGQEENQAQVVPLEMMGLLDSLDQLVQLEREALQVQQDL